jgi:putative FmdB family regulatory protein
MPIYEYECLSCEREFQSLIMKRDQERSLVCPGCGGRNLKKLISRVAYHVGEQDRLDAFDPGARKDDSFYRDSRNIGLYAKKRAQQMGVDLGTGFEEKLEKLRTDPSSVIKDSSDR